MDPTLTPPVLYGLSAAGVATAVRALPWPARVLARKPLACDACMCFWGSVAVACVAFWLRWEGWVDLRAALPGYAVAVLSLRVGRAPPIHIPDGVL